ncbi:unnamed protein product, partial [marine sediment metagenome]
MFKGKKDKPKGDAAWETDDPFAGDITLEQLVDRTPFKESKDQYGHSVTAGTRIPDWLARKVERIIEHQGSPYDLKSDVYRDALFLGFQIIGLRLRIAADWEAEAKLSEIADATYEGARVRDRTNTLARGLEYLVDEGDMDKAAELLGDYIRLTQDLTVDWSRKRIFRELSRERIIQKVAVYCDPDVQDILNALVQCS